MFFAWFLPTVEENIAQEIANQITLYIGSNHKPYNKSG